MMDPGRVFSFCTEYFYRFTSTYSFFHTPNWYFESVLRQHAVRTPLTSLSLSLADLKSAQSLRSVRMTAEQAEKSYERLASLYSDQFKEIEESFTIADSVSAVASCFNESRVKILQYWQNGADTLVLTGNRFHFEQLIEILISNGMEAQQDVAVVIIKGTLLNNCLLLLIQDYGTGMALSERLLCPLVGYSSKQSGHGMGMACAKRILTEFKGNLQLRSWQGIGTQAICELPLGRE